MKTKFKVLNLVFILLLAFILLFVNTTKTLAQEYLGGDWGPSPSGRGQDQEEGGGVFYKTGLAFANGLLMLVTFFIKLVAKLIHFIISWVNLHWAAPLADYFLSLDPFYSSGPNSSSPSEKIWFILKTYSYIILVFSALFAGFQWILGEDKESKSLIFTILIVAFFVDFSYLFIKESFYIVKAIEKGIVGETEVVQPSGQSKTVPSGSALGSLIASAAWRYDPSKEIEKVTDEISKTAQGLVKNEGFFQNFQKTNREGLMNSVVAIAFSIFFVAFAMLIFVTLGVLIGLGLARYLILIFLAAVSSLAFVSLAFPKFKPPFNILTSIVSNSFNNWVKNVFSWLIVVPVFSILIILGLILQENFLAASSNFGGIFHNDLFKFIIALLIIFGWFVIALRIAIQLSGKVGEIAYSGSMGLLKWAGMTFGGGYIARAGSKLAASVLEKTSSFAAKRAGFGWIGRRMHGISKTAGGIAEKMRGKQYAESRNVALDLLKNAYSDLENARTDEEKEAALGNLNRILEKITKDKNLVRIMGGDVKRYIALSLRQAADNPNLVQNQLKLISQLGDSSLQEEIIQQFDPKTVKKIMSHIKDDNFSKNIEGLPPVIQKFLAGKVKDLKESDAIDLMADPNFRKNINTEKLGPLKGALNEASNGLLNAIIENNVDDAKNALSSLSSDGFRKLDVIDRLLRESFGDGTGDIIRDVFERNRDNLIAGAKKFRNSVLEQIFKGVFQQNPNLLRLLTVDELKFTMRFLDPQFLQDNLSTEVIKALGMLPEEQPGQTGGGASGGGSSGGGASGGGSSGGGTGKQPGKTYKPRQSNKKKKK